MVCSSCESICSRISRKVSCRPAYIFMLYFFFVLCFRSGMSGKTSRPATCSYGVPFSAGMSRKVDYHPSYNYAAFFLYLFLLRYDTGTGKL